MLGAEYLFGRKHILRTRARSRSAPEYLRVAVNLGLSQPDSFAGSESARPLVYSPAAATPAREWVD
jgi:hypothetical protein